MSTPINHRFGLGVIALCAGAAACTGTIGEPGTDNLQQIDNPGSGSGTGSPGGPAVDACLLGTNTPARIRRLTREEIDRTFSDLLGEEVTPTEAFPVDSQSNGYTNQADSLVVTPLFVEALGTTAEELAARVVERLGEFSSCSDGDACAEAFIQDFGRRAYRRDLTGEEVDSLFAVYAAGAGGADFASGIELMLHALFQSPNFIYRTELGEGRAGDGVVRLSQHEIATELAYLVIGAPPDDALMAAADATELESSDARAQQVERLLQDPRAREQMSTFVFQWIGIQGIEQAQKDPEVYPDFSAGLAQKMSEETTRFIEDVVFDGDSSLHTLLRADYTFADAELAALYGAQAAAGNELSRVALDPGQRSGILTQGSVLSMFAQSTQSSPVRRGKFVRTRLLCQTLPSPPLDVAVVPPPPSESNTTRERFAAHAQEACAECHKLIDPLGFGFENFDGIGRYRTEENGFPVDATGDIIGTEDADGPFDGAIELAERLAQSSHVRACFVNNWLQFSMARHVAAADQCTKQSAFEGFMNGERTIRDLVVDIASSDEFVLRLPMQN
jgi:hypothetical protein